MKASPFFFFLAPFSFFLLYIYVLFSYFLSSPASEVSFKLREGSLGNGNQPAADNDAVGGPGFVVAPPPCLSDKETLLEGIHPVRIESSDLGQ